MVQATDKYGIMSGLIMPLAKAGQPSPIYETKGFKLMVVDFKDDLGFITYDTQVPLAHKIKAVQRRLNIQAPLGKRRKMIFTNWAGGRLQR